MSLIPPTGPISSSTSATQTKERLYAQLAVSLGRTSRAISQTAGLCEQLQIDLHAMRIFAGLDAAKFMTVAAQLNPEGEEEDGEDQQEEAEETKEKAKQHTSRSPAQPQGSKKGKQKDQNQTLLSISSET